MSTRSIINSIRYLLRTQGIVGLMHVVSANLRSLIGLRAASFQTYEGLFRDKKGIEFGGPSQVFSKDGIFPVYPIIEHLDNCNFSSKTVWKGDIKAGETYRFDHLKPPGHQYIADATSMKFISTGTYDFVLASHILEHVANPILALSEWLRLLKDHGTLVILIPLKSGNFDHRRPVTTLDHLIKDFVCGVTEDDLTHMPEILALHDLERDTEAGNMADFKARSTCNFVNRCFHHHVFDTQLAARLMDYMGMQVKAVETIQPTHILILAQKLRANETSNNLAFTGNSA